MQKSKITDNCRSTSTADFHSISRFKEIRTQTFNNVIIGNLSSLAFKFSELRLLVTSIFDILIIIETKLNDTFALSQLHIGFSTPYRLDRNRNGGGLIIYIREDIPSKIITKHCFPKDMETLFIGLNFRKCKRLLCGLYHPPSQKDKYLFDNIDKALDVYSPYEKVILSGDFTSQIAENCIDTFMYQHNLQSTNKEASCYKNPNNPSCIDLFSNKWSKKFLQN